MICFGVAMLLFLAVFFFRPVVGAGAAPAPGPRPRAGAGGPRPAPAPPPPPARAGRLMGGGVGRQVTLARIAGLGSRSRREDDEDDEEIDDLGVSADGAATARGQPAGRVREEEEREEAAVEAALRAAAAKAGPAPPPARHPRPGAEGEAAAAGVRGGRGRVDGVTLRYSLAFAFLAAVFLVWFAAGGVRARDACEHFTTERVYAGLRRAEASTVLFFAQELVSEATAALGPRYGTPGRLEEARRSLSEALHHLMERHRSLVVGDEAEGLRGSLGRYAPQEALLWGRPCLDARDACRAAGTSGNGLHRLLNTFKVHAEMLAASPRHLLAPNNTHFTFVRWAVDGGPLDGKMRESIALYVAEAREARPRPPPPPPPRPPPPRDLEAPGAALTRRCQVLEAYMLYNRATLGMCAVAILLSYLFVFRKIVESMADDARRTLFLLLIIPAEVAPRPAPPRPVGISPSRPEPSSQVIESVESIRAHLVRKAAGAAAL
eukprot:tig00021319_g20215.t1